ncbi:hypothetical protein IF1G_09997 [Cordyceps javanica]|uniref:Aminoglycoside phosphotransferase domain-containing protein n=1 Tax=Cordyceps javanica TaxID=43265 RepID=A0A545UPV7_9HYPO|nr:hypothetical protein IF1G_09997 [Cordyceps javanica]
MLHDPLNDQLLHGSHAELNNIISQSPRRVDHDGISLLSSCLAAEVYHEEHALLTSYPAGTGARHWHLVINRIYDRKVEEHPSRLAAPWSFSLRSLTSDTAGSLVIGACGPFWLDDRFGLPAGATTDMPWTLPSPTSILRITLRTQHCVLAHHDLAPPNVIVDAAGDERLLDWDDQVLLWTLALAGCHVACDWSLRGAEPAALGHKIHVPAVFGRTAVQDQSESHALENPDRIIGVFGSIKYV